MSLKHLIKTPCKLLTQSILSFRLINRSCFSNSDPRASYKLNTIVWISFACLINILSVGVEKIPSVTLQSVNFGKKFQRVGLLNMLKRNLLFSDQACSSSNSGVSSSNSSNDQKTPIPLYWILLGHFMLLGTTGYLKKKCVCVVNSGDFSTRLIKI